MFHKSGKQAAPEWRNDPSQPQGMYRQMTRKGHRTSGGPVTFSPIVRNDAEDAGEGRAVQVPWKAGSLRLPLSSGLVRQSITVCSKPRNHPQDHETCWRAAAWIRVCSHRRTVLAVKVNSLHKHTYNSLKGPRRRGHATF